MRRSCCSHPASRCWSALSRRTRDPLRSLRTRLSVRVEFQRRRGIAIGRLLSSAHIHLEIISIIDRTIINFSDIVWKKSAKRITQLPKNWFCFGRFSNFHTSFEFYQVLDIMFSVTETTKNELKPNFLGKKITRNFEHKFVEVPIFDSLICLFDILISLPKRKKEFCEIPIFSKSFSESFKDIF